MMQITQNEQYDCPEVNIGNWKIVIHGVDWEGAEQIRAIYKEEPLTYLYDLLGFEMHSQQQGQSKITFKGMEAYCEKLADTCGAPLDVDTILIVATTRQPLGLLCNDEPIT